MKQDKAQTPKAVISWRIATERNAWRWSFSYLATISNAKHNSPTVLNIARLCAFQVGLGRTFQDKAPYTPLHSAY